MTLITVMLPSGWRRCTAVFLARIVMPFSFSRSPESIRRSTASSPRWVRAPDCRSMASTSVVLPWSTCATMATLRNSGRASGEGTPEIVAAPAAGGLTGKRSHQGGGQCGKPYPVRGNPVHGGQLAGRHPAQGAVIVVVQVASGLGDLVGPQNPGAGQRDVLAQSPPHPHIDAEFLAKFALQSRGLGFARGNLSAGQLPQSGQLRWALPLGEKDCPIANQCAGHDDLKLGRHRSRRYTVSLVAVLNDDQVAAAVANLDGWEHTGGTLRWAVTFPSFLDGIEAVRTVAELADRDDHHPDIDIRWRTVTFTLVTHSAGGITEKDVALAGQIRDALAGR